MRKLFAHLLILACCATQVKAQSAYDSVHVSIKKFMTEQHVPGFATCIVKDGKIVWSKAYGQADIAKERAMSIDGIMNIGSVSKTFTTTAAMQLWEKGLIDLNADVSIYLGFKVRNPKYPDKPITVFQILTHTSSVIDSKAYEESYACGDPTQSLDNWIRSILTPDGSLYNNGDTYANWSPGDKRQYSNVAFGLLGLIVEKVARQPFNLYCKENIFQPLGMYKTGWLLSEVDTSNYIRPYAYITAESRKEYMAFGRLFPNESEFKVGTYIPVCLYSFPNYPDGLVRTSVRDLSFFMTALLNGGELNGKRILKKETIDKMFTSQLEGYQAQGLTWRTSEFEGKHSKVKLWGHSGLDPGIQTFMFFNRENKTGVITFQNSPADGIPKIVGELYEAATISDTQ
ncbi:serine hydrolase domain-containing protein [Chitinophaga ginsengisoli]|uniref:CubicO group peptidase (Beta-lactamase class C family) n=1 Tax=Chitinophaga ginsengisoli TaxID=363837 RepID=A0A2P8GKJ0_9BACT|nr:serine hydrolase domain-containing protein [Chitinophaga ginsengisoli]PSL34487.1 CubicO group peptidase (beta-lactamase class C family) [Chitinophaga ginsengisoli]